MSTYDFTAAEEFLREEAGITPEQLHKEIWAAWCNVSDMETKENRHSVGVICDTLLTCADFFACLMPAAERVQP